MDIFLSDKSTVIFLVFSIYATSVIFLIPNTISLEPQNVEIDNQTQQPIKLVSRFILRIALIFPMLILLQNAL